MKKACFKLGTFVLMMGSSFYSWSDNACLPIGEACMKAGYYRGGSDVGKGLIEDCVLPIVNNSKKLPNITFTDTELQGCKAMLMEKMKEQSQ